MNGPAPERWTYYRLEDGSVCLIIGETTEFAWALDPETGEQWDIDRAEFIDDLMDGTIEKVRPMFEAVEADARERRTQGAAA